MQVLEYERQYLASLPLAEMYEKSYMHRDAGEARAGLAVPPPPLLLGGRCCCVLPQGALACTRATRAGCSSSGGAALPRPPPLPPPAPLPAPVTQVAVAQASDFLITASVDGHIKFWKKQPEVRCGAVLQGGAQRGGAQRGVRGGGASTQRVHVLLPSPARVHPRPRSPPTPPQGVEFAKHYKAHLGPVTGLAVSADGALCASISTDRSVKVFDVASFDMIAMLKLPYVPGCVEWCFQARACEEGGGGACASIEGGGEGGGGCTGCGGGGRAWRPRQAPTRARTPPPLPTPPPYPPPQLGDSKAKLAVSDAGSGGIHLYDVRSGSSEPVGGVAVHAAPVSAMRYNAAADAIISTDEKGEGGG